MVRSLPVPAALIDASGTVLAVSEARGSMPDDVAPAWDGLRVRVVRSGQALVQTVRSPGPPPLVLMTTVTPVVAPDGRVTAALLVAFDVTEAEEDRERVLALEKERRLLREIIDHIPDQVYAKDARHRFVVANRAVARKILGTDENERLLGRTDHDFFPQEDADRYRDDEQRLMASRRDLIDLEERALYQGEETWNLTSKLLLRGAGGGVEGIVGINRDVTARRRAEQALAAERALLTSLMDNSPDLIFFKDREGRLTAINAAYARVLRLKSPAEAVGRTVGDFFGPDHFRESRREEEPILTEGRSLLGKEEKVSAPAGGTRWMLVSKVPVRDASGEIKGLLGIARDITERKTAEEVLARGLEEFLEVASAVSEGDLTRRGRAGEDTLGRVAAAVNRMLGRFGETLEKVQRLAEAVSTSAAEIRIASNEIALGAHRQSEETLGVSAAAEEIARSMGSVARNAEEAAEMALHAEETAQQGDRVARQASEAMERIERSVAASVEKMRQHERASEEVLDVVETIKDFADQTNLLSLNAAIEAARAGASGAGFNVIAGAIRELADKSAAAAKDVDSRLNAMQVGTTEALGSMEETTREIRNGLRLVDDSLQDLRAITTAVAAAASRSGDISSAAREQTVVTDDLAQRMHTIAGIAAQTSAAAEETARTVVAAARVADELRAALERFRLA